MPSSQLTKNATDQDLDRELFLDGVLLRGFVRAARMTVAQLEARVSLQMLGARREERAELHWQLAVIYWATDRKAAAYEAARRYLTTRSPTEVERVTESARSRVANEMRRSRKPAGLPRRTRRPRSQKR